MVSFPGRPSGADAPLTFFGRLRSFGYFIIAVLVYFFLVAVAQGFATHIQQTSLQYLVARGVLLLLQLVTFAGMGYAFQGQRQPIAAMGLPRRKGMLREFLLGLCIGWGMILACILPLSIFGGIVFTVNLTPAAWGLLAVNLLVLLVASLQEETVYRGYPFQRLVNAMNPLGASLAMALIFGLAHMRNPGATTTSFLVTCLSALIFATAYLRTRALWLAWGVHLGWNATLGLLFGLPVSGMTVFSTVLSGEAVGPAWLTGGQYGIEGSWLGVVVMFAGLVVMFRATRDLNYLYNAPVLHPAGMPIDLNAFSQQQHEAAQGQVIDAPKPLVQITPMSASGDNDSPINSSNSTNG